MSNPQALAAKSERPHRPLTEFYQDPEERPEYIARLFDKSAVHYDWISSVMALGSAKVSRAPALPGPAYTENSTG